MRFQIFCKWMQSNVPINKGSGFLACFRTCEIRERERVSIGVWPFMIPCVCLCVLWKACLCCSSQQPKEAIFYMKQDTLRDINTLPFPRASVHTSSRVNTMKKEPQAAKKHTKQQGETVPNPIKMENVSRTTARLFRECPQSRRVNKTQYLLDL